MQHMSKHVRDPLHENIVHRLDLGVKINKYANRGITTYQPLPGHLIQI